MNGELESALSDEWGIYLFLHLSMMGLTFLYSKWKLEQSRERELVKLLPKWRIQSLVAGNKFYHLLSITVQDWLILTQSTTLGESATVVDWHILTQSTTLGESPTVVDWLILTQSTTVGEVLWIELVWLNPLQLLKRIGNFLQLVNIVSFH